MSGNVLLRRQQYRTSDDPAGTLKIARSLVLAKIANSRTVLMRGARDQDISDKQADLEKATLRLECVLRDVGRAESTESVRGYEGDAARTYFSYSIR